MQREKIIAVVGLGLIGGSLAAALRGFEDYTVVGVVRRQETADYAVSHEVCDRVTLDPMEVLPEADVVWLCMNPQGIVDYMARYRDVFRAGALVTDVGGIKTAIMEGAGVLPETVDFIGCHPMAGTEFSGIEHSFPTMFQRAHFILTPRPSSTPEHIALMRRVSAYIGCSDVVTTTPERHDAIIAYTSQLMHIIAVSVCDDEELFQCRGFEGGSFRDCTRVAALDVDLWTQLFSMNAPALTREIDRLVQNLSAYRDAIAGGDVQALSDKLTWSANRKRQMNLPGPGQIML
ncbi:MAG: prephenate dehydrogenase/arogenate dehydrogenase family protein [Clostridiales bacterium]|nr:prephenate dehydrogenase/arogenate dehydrogenase family protein [Clostridiales bacterium]